MGGAAGAQEVVLVGWSSEKVKVFWLTRPPVPAVITE